MRSDIGAWRLHPTPGERCLQDGVDLLAIDEGAMRSVVRDEQRARGRDPVMPDIVCQSLANVRRYRHSVMPLPLAAYDQLTGPPVDIIELDGDHLRRAQTKAREQEDHGIVAAPETRIVSHRRQHGFYLFSIQKAGQ